MISDAREISPGVFAVPDNLPATIHRQRLLHYSQRPIKLVEPGSFKQTHPYLDMTGMKPHGFWISAEGDDDWKQWCLSERFRLINLRYTHEVILRSDANVLWIKTIEELDAFDEKYMAENSPLDILNSLGNAADALNFAKVPKSLRQRISGIDWRKVAGDYQGIIISPYQWQRRLGDSLWYYTWDCASGCIWDGAAIAECRLTNERAVSERQIKIEIHKRMTKRKRKKLFALVNNLAMDRGSV